MISEIARAAEEYYGIKADPDDIRKLEAHLIKSYGGQDAEIIDKVFSSGEAAAFLTVNESYFFREPAHFAFLRELLPSFRRPPEGSEGAAEGLPEGATKGSALRICCAAVATGCEAYSLAMLIEAHNRGIENPLQYHIDAFDINPKAIETAQLGLYSPRALRDDGSNFHYMAMPYIKKLETKLQLDLSLKKNISFFVHNLMNEIPGKDYDIIFFRNAFIYFTPSGRSRVLSNLSSALKNGGVLLMGVSETAGADPVDLESRNKNDVFYFQKEQ